MSTSRHYIQPLHQQWSLAINKTFKIMNIYTEVAIVKRRKINRSLATTIGHKIIKLSEEIVKSKGS